MRKQPGPTADQINRIAALEKETAANPEDEDSWIRLGNLYFNMQKTDQAIATYEKALKLDPDNADVMTDLGVMYRWSGLPVRMLVDKLRGQAKQQT